MKLPSVLPTVNSASSSSRDHVLRGGLAGAAGDRRPPSPPSPPRPRRQRLQAPPACRRRESAGPPRPGLPLDYRRASALWPVLSDVIMPIVSFPTHGKEQIPGLHSARINAEARDHSAISRRCAKYFCDVRKSSLISDVRSRSSFIRRAHPFIPLHSPANAEPAAPLRGRRTRSSGPSEPDTSRVLCRRGARCRPARLRSRALRMAFARSGSATCGVSKRRRPTSASFMMSSGSSVRGLSEVSTTKSLCSPAAMPISGRLARSRSPPQPNSVMTRFGVEAARHRDHVAQRVVGVRVVHHHQERLALVDALEAAGHGAAGGDAARRSAPGRARRTRLCTTPPECCRH